MRPRTADPANVAVAIPVKNEEAAIGACLAALDQAASRHPGRTTIVAVANDCDDRTVEILSAARPAHARLIWTAVSLLPGHRHAGWARRLAFDAAAAVLSHEDDLLLSTDADTEVDGAWIVRNAAHLGRGIDAVAGRALTRRAERKALGGQAFDRLNMLGRYYGLADYLRTAGDAHETEGWPRHFYEGGASIALRLGMYRAIGGAPTPPVAEDRALFDRIRAHGGNVVHPIDVRVFTSCRLDGRAPGGMADTFRTWIAQGEDDPLHETYRMAAALAPHWALPGDRLSFRTLPAAVKEAQALLKATRRGASAPAPEVEPVRFPPVMVKRPDTLAQTLAEQLDRVIPAQRVVGQPGPVDQQDVAAGPNGIGHIVRHPPDIVRIPVIDDLGQEHEVEAAGGLVGRELAALEPDLLETGAARARRRQRGLRDVHGQ
ncbi:hypothetical protein GGR88_000851 [Sphingomonas jejuensis]|uniref:Glycosyltransferase 2-like domain-containing protein n=1 Tax=Sphingomonas jejuensis TaxID=904715 RepID=A0ABX0XKR6_9SPHN|nr:hypothetical protein [Sphingomonas jejuensis]